MKGLPMEQLRTRVAIVKDVRRLAETVNEPIAKMLTEAADRLDLDGLIFEQIGQFVAVVK